VCMLGPTRRLAAGNSLGQILLWDLPEKPDAPAPLPMRRLDGHTNAITRLLASPDGRWLISSSFDHTIRFWDMQAPAAGADALVLNGRLLSQADRLRRAGIKIPPPLNATVAVQSSARSLTTHDEWIQGMAQSADGKTLLSGDDGGRVILWDASA